MSKKVLIISPLFPPIGGPGVQRVLKFVKYLPEEGWEPSVICGHRALYFQLYDESLLKEIPKTVEVARVNYTMVEDYSEIASIIGSIILFPLRLHFTKERIREGLEWRLYHYFYRLYPEPLLSWLYAASRKAIQLHKRKRFDAVMTSGPPHVTHLVGLILKYFLKVKWVADFRDAWTDNVVQRDEVGYRNKLYQLLERPILRNSDTIVTVSPSLAELFSKKLPEPEDGKIQVIHNGFDPEDIPGDLSEQRRLYDRDILHIHFNGTFQGLSNKPDLFFRGVAELKRRIADVNGTLVCTFTGLPSYIMDMAREMGLSKIVIDVGTLSHRESLGMSAGCDVLLLIQHNVDKTVKGTMTGKVYEYVAMGKEILAIIPFDGDLYKFLKNFEKCHIVKCDDLEGIVKELQLLVRKKKDNQLVSFDPPPWIMQYTRQAQTKKLANIFKSLTQSNSS